jgi:hypothetical protein
VDLGRVGQPKEQLSSAILDINEYGVFDSEIKANCVEPNW